jgi:hypothetical protein
VQDFLRAEFVLYGKGISMNKSIAERQKMGPWRRRKFVFSEDQNTNSQMAGKPGRAYGGVNREQSAARSEPSSMTEATAQTGLK